MAKMFQRGVRRFFALGTSGCVDAELSRKIILSNKLAALIFVIASPYFFFFQKISFSFAGMVLPLLVLFALVPVLNWRGHNVLARMLLLITACGGAFFYADSLGREAGVQFLYFSFLGMPLGLFSLREKKLLYCSLFVPVFCFFLLEFYNYTLFSDVFISSSYLKFIYSTALVFVSLLIVFYLHFYISEIEASHISLQTAYTRLEAQQILLKRRINAINAMMESCRTLPEWESKCTQIFRHHLNMSPRVWLAEEGQILSLDSEAMYQEGSKGRSPFDPTSSYGQALLSQTGCFTWSDSGVSVLLPLLAGATLVGLIGLAPEDALSDDDREFAVMVAKELQKGLQLIRSIEAMKTLNMSGFVQKNEALFRELNITERELEVIGLLVQGVPNAQISSTLVVTESTTKRHVYNIFRKLKISNRFELMKWMNERVVAGTPFRIVV